MIAVIEAEGLGKRYRKQWALTDCTLSIPAGHVVGLVGLNGAGKTTLLNLATGMLADSRVRIAGSVDDLLAAHHLLSGPRRDPVTLPAGMRVISASHTDRQSTLLVRADGPVLDPAWTVSEVGLEDLMLAYMKQAAGGGQRNRHLEALK